jgi:hypothetical protein
MCVALTAIAAVGVLVVGCNQCARIERSQVEIKQLPSLNFEKSAETAIQPEQSELRLRAPVKSIGTADEASAQLVGITDRAGLHQSMTSNGQQSIPPVPVLLQEHNHMENVLWIIENDRKMVGSN